jgi:hypothetical protein
VPGDPQVAGMANPAVNKDMTPINAPGRQYRTVIVRPSGAVTNTRTTPETTSSRCGSGSPSQWVTEPAGTRILVDPISRPSSTSAGSPSGLSAR